VYQWSRLAANTTLLAHIFKKRRETKNNSELTKNANIDVNYSYFVELK
jgi:hypothetical protein